MFSYQKEKLTVFKLSRKMAEFTTAIVFNSCDGLELPSTKKCLIFNPLQLKPDTFRLYEHSNKYYINVHVLCTVDSENMYVLYFL